MLRRRLFSPAFTLIELSVVIVIVGILATIVSLEIFSLQRTTRDSSRDTSVKIIANSLENYYRANGEYPSVAFMTSQDAETIRTKLGLTSKETLRFPLAASNVVNSIGSSNPSTTILVYSASTTDVTKNSQCQTDLNGYCDAFQLQYKKESDGSLVTLNSRNNRFVAIADDAMNIQTVTSANCPTTRTMTVDARDNHTYWIMKLSNGKCWMLTNLAYGGGGANTYNDTKTIFDKTGVGGNANYPWYYVNSGANPTSNPTAPSTSTNGMGQYGYLYNWCAAMGAQTGTGACSETSMTPTPSTAISICPSGWRLPTGVSGGEFTALNTAVNGGSTTSDSGLRTTWLSQYGGSSGGGAFFSTGTVGDYWSSSAYTIDKSYLMYITSNNINPAWTNYKTQGYAVRCVAN